ncbi:hypothetical protein EKH57_17800 (plasmid) [Halorubrum sp. BOL3-1]|uniref:hypothetical protein n=1 Tax=Halorubrum sp. BOL3-1 TaxID=2497325 RepID=UPI001004E092|nr:hypothetical protein [Halorubrum sp. BOL3-1]QAU14532.1 hypothetical protein EKH57_17800 [Halorubrum sp. BOL3-1]
MKQLYYDVTVECTSSAARDTIDTLASEKSDGHISGYTIEYRDNEGELKLHIWHDIPDGDNLDTHYDKVNTVLSKLPVSVPLEAEDSPIRYKD